jgi:hypothetical protein
MPFDGTQLSPATQALIEGRQQIEAGWCQGIARMAGAVCTAAAVSHSLNAIQMLYRALGHERIVDFNDAADRTKEDVLDLYDRAIALSLNAP